MVSTVFDLDREGARALAEQAASNPLRTEEIAPSFFDSALSAAGMGIMRGGAKLGDTMATFGSFWDPPGADKEAWDRAQDEIRKETIEFWTPEAKEVGTAGRVLGGLGEMVLPLTVAAGNPSVLMANQSIQTGKDLVNEGVDASTAVAVGTTEALATGIGFKLPFLGSTLASRMATGATGNLLLGTASTAVERQILESQGYEDQAKPYDPFNAEARTVDLLSGLLFGGIAHLTTPKDAALTANNAKHFQQDTAPGIPKDSTSSIIHQDAIEQAIQDLEAGKPVHTREVSDAVFLRKPPTTEVPPAVEAAAHELELPETVKSDSAPNSEAYSVEEGVLSDEQIQAFQGLRSDIPAEKVVGGSGERIPGQQGRQDVGRSGEPLTVFRGSDEPLAAEHFQTEALGKASGHPSSGLGVFFTNDKVDAARYGSNVEEAHLDIRKPKIIKFEDLPSFDTLEEATAFREKLRKQGYDGIVLDASHYDGPVQYVAFDAAQYIPKKAVAKAAPQPEIKAPDSTGIDEPIDVDHELAISKATPIETQAAEDALMVQDFEIPTGEIDADGKPKTISARELLEQAKEDVKTAKKESSMFETAVSCFLSAGP